MEGTMSNLVKSIPRSVSTAILVLVLMASQSASQELAFPGAEGFGRFVTGGRGGRVVKVSNLNDSGPGSLRAAIDMSGPRIIVFETGGLINLNSNLIIKNNDITIAGQTAPGDGICLAGAQLTVKARNVIIRGLRVRVGSSVFENAILFIRPASNVIVDHCSFSWSRDAVVQTWDSVNTITIQNCIIAEPLNTAGASAHAVAFGPGPKDLESRFLTNATLYRNIIAHSKARNPKVHYEAEVINNLVYNWMSYACFASVYANFDFIGNHYIEGPNTGGANTISLQLPDPSLRIFVNDNITPERPANNGNNWNIVNGAEAYRAFNRLNPSGLVPSPVGEVLEDVRANAGAILPARDEVDTRIINDILMKTGGIIASENEVGGFPDYDEGSAPSDNDDDGMPNQWEIENGSNPNNADAAGDVDQDGYANIEEYINGLFFGITTSKSDLDGVIPSGFAVHQNYPNPFNPSTTLRYDLPEDSNVMVTIYNVLGQPVANLFDGEQVAGSHELEWVAQSVNGKPLASGPYFYRVQATSVTGKTFDRTMKLILMK
jgi:hypothetical protein